MTRQLAIATDAPPRILAAEVSHHRFIRDVFFTNLPLPVMKLRSYLWMAMLSRSLGPDGYGAWSLFQTTLDIAISIGSMTLGGAMMRFLSGDRTREEQRTALSSVYTANIAAGTLIALLLIVFSATLATTLFHGIQHRPLLLAVAVILVTDLVFEQTRGFLRARRINRNWAVLTLSRMVPEMILAIAAAAFFRTAMAPVVVYGTCSVLAAVCGVAYLLRRQQFKFVPPSWTALKRYLKFGLALVPGSLAASLSFSADKYLVGHYLDLSQVGIYSVCFTVSALGFFLVGPVNDVLLPELSALQETGDWLTFDRRFAGIQKFVFGAAMCATAVLVCFPRQILRLIAAESFSSGSTALAILGLQGVFMSGLMLYEVLLKVQLRAWTSSAIWTGMGVMILGLDVVLIPRMGIEGAAISQLASSVAGAAVVIAMSWSVFRRTFQLSWMLRAMAVLAVLKFSALLAPPQWMTAPPVVILLVGGSSYAWLLLASGYTSVVELRAWDRLFGEGRHEHSLGL